MKEAEQLLQVGLEKVKALTAEQQYNRDLAFKLADMLNSNIQKQLDREHEVYTINLKHWNTMAEDQKKAYLELQRMAAQFGYDLKLVDANTGREIKVLEKQGEINEKAAAKDNEYKKEQTTLEYDLQDRNNKKKSNY